MPDVGRIAIKDIFLELLYTVKDTSIIDAKALCSAVTAFSYDFIKRCYLGIAKRWHGRFEK